MSLEDKVAQLEQRAIEKRRQARALYGWEVKVFYCLIGLMVVSVVGIPFAIPFIIFVWVRHPKRFVEWVEPIDYWKEAERAEELGLFESARMWREEAMYHHRSE